ncbi:pre-mRNA cleavage factor Im 25 kDa subunit 1 isoform X2 [Henckelia pumila]|uniref:pre-mRNA cleavage factor Im 25 kDa subunit 1 isoform X2 n=1 Tax=Henckelia pumila TaxID=405737 RepID=UPI003C6DE76C
MANQTVVLENGNSHQSADHSGTEELDIYPLSCYYFGSREAVSVRNETVAERVLRMKANYDAYGMRKCVSAVLVVELFKHPHILLLQIQNSTFKLPGGRLDIDGLKRKLSSNLSVGEDGRGPEWEIGECLGIWWRPNFESVLYPFLPAGTKKAKECHKLFLVKLPASRRFIVPRNFKLLAVPLCQLHDNEEVKEAVTDGSVTLIFFCLPNVSLINFCTSSSNSRFKLFVTMERDMILQILEYGGYEPYHTGNFIPEFRGFVATETNALIMNSRNFALFPYRSISCMA